MSSNCNEAKGKHTLFILSIQTMTVLVLCQIFPELIRHTVIQIVLNQVKNVFFLEVGIMDSVSPETSP